MRNPLDRMRIRGHSLSHTYGMVRTYRDGRPKPHQGWDLAARVGTPVYAIAAGTIQEVSRELRYGLQIILAFPAGGVTAYAHYAHLSSVACTVGDAVTEGALIGFTGNSGVDAARLPTAEHHLHFEIRTGGPHPGGGLHGHVDPGAVLGYSHHVLLLGN